MPIRSNKGSRRTIANICRPYGGSSRSTPSRSREAVEARDGLIEHLCGLSPVQSALDQILHHFGTGAVAEITGRSRRIVRQAGPDGVDRLVLRNRPAGANLSETQAFQDDETRILVFSDAGGTGRSYHANRGAKNQRLRVHYLLEAGWKADAAVQGLGRTNRTNQAQAPLFRPVTTNVKGEKRFLSTIARRLDTLGAITRGQRQTGGQGLFRPEDILEGPYAATALRQLYWAIVRGEIAGCSLSEFEASTGLSLTSDTGAVHEELTPTLRSRSARSRASTARPCGSRPPTGRSRRTGACESPRNAPDQSSRDRLPESPLGKNSLIVIDASIRSIYAKNIAPAETWSNFSYSTLMLREPVRTPMLRSTRRRFGRRTKPFDPSGRRTTSIARFNPD
ncbi:C-terminal domain on Strawberry notch homologue [Methylobacterium sp. ap11]|nr:C-terminal domain on Strawberry notch homologue [Methylobacterium sp. ap11]